MGMYATGTLFYGYILDDVDMPEDEDGELIQEFDLAEKILRERGVVDPWDSHPGYEHLNYEEQYKANAKWHADHSAELDAWYKAKREIEDTIKVELSWYGHYDESHAYLEVKGTSHSASPSYPTSIDELWTDPQWVHQLDDFLRAWGIEPPEDGPCWWLVASYG